MAHPHLKSITLDLWYRPSTRDYKVALTVRTKTTPDHGQQTSMSPRAVTELVALVGIQIPPPPVPDTVQKKN